MIEFLVTLLDELSIAASDVLGETKKYKFLTKQIRLKLKKLHPDAGGQKDAFEQTHKLYETLLTYSKKDADGEKQLQAALRTIETGKLTKDNLKNSNRQFSFDEIVGNVDKFVTPNRKHYLINIAELVLHFNKLRYCQAEERPEFVQDMMTANVHLHAVEQTDDNKEEHTKVIMNILKPYSPSGKYAADIALQLSPGAKLTVGVEGFEAEQTKEFSSSGIYMLHFEENLITLTIALTIKI